MGKRSNSFSGGFCIMAALAILVLPLKWLMAAASAALWHEICHLLALRLLGGKWMPLGLFASGARIIMPDMSRGRELLCAFAGPAGSLMLALLHPWLPLPALFGLVQGIYNLIPIYPLDGGRALACIADELLPPVYALWLREFVAWGFIGGAITAAFYLMLFAGWGIAPLVAVFLLLGPRFAGNCPCKPGRLGLQ